MSYSWILQVLSQLFLEMYTIVALLFLGMTSVLEAHSFPRFEDSTSRRHFCSQIVPLSQSCFLRTPAVSGRKYRYTWCTKCSKCFERGRDRDKQRERERKRRNKITQIVGGSVEIDLGDRFAIERAKGEGKLLQGSGRWLRDTPELSRTRAIVLQTPKFAVRETARRPRAHLTLSHNSCSRPLFCSCENCGRNTGSNPRGYPKTRDR